MGRSNQLTNKQTLFIDAYMKHFSPKKAAIEAGYDSKNPSKVGYSTLQSPLVKAEIERQMEARREALQSVPFDTIVINLIEISNDEATPLRERMKAMDLLIKYKQHNKWNADDVKTVDSYVEALKEQIGDVWKGDSE